MCDRHYNELVFPLAAALDRHGLESETMELPQCLSAGPLHPGTWHWNGPRGCRLRTRLAGTLWQHLRGMHNLTMDEYCEKYGRPQPLTQDVVVEVACELCGKEYSSRHHRWPRGALVSHMRGRHAMKLWPDGSLTPIGENP